MKISPEHDALLKACTSIDDEFVSNLRAWEEIQDIETIDFASMRLIPYLYRKAERLNVQMAQSGICKGLYLRAWYMHTTNKTPLLDWIEHQEVFDNAILLKGAALQQTIYKTDPPLRPSDDVDLLLSRADVKRAMDSLENQEFQVDHKLSRSTMLNLRHGVNYYGHEKSVDIHWGLFPVCLDPKFTSRVLDRAIQVSDKLKILTPTDNLIHCLIHGYGINEILPIRWVVDAQLLIISGDVDWKLFWEEIDCTGWYGIVIEQIKFLSRYNISIDVPKKIENRSNLIMFVCKTLLRTKNIYLRRILRILGYDFGVWAQNVGIRPTTYNYLKTINKWLPLTLTEWREFVSNKSS